MNIRLDVAQLELRGSQALRLEDAAGASIRCHSGSVWVTQQHDQRDIVLGAGEDFCVDQPGTTVVAALTPSSVVIDGSSRCAGTTTPMRESIGARIAAAIQDSLSSSGIRTPRLR